MQEVYLGDGCKTPGLPLEMRTGMKRRRIQEIFRRQNLNEEKQMIREKKSRTNSQFLAWAAW